MSINLDNVKSIQYNNKQVKSIKTSDNKVIWMQPSYAEVRYANGYSGTYGQPDYVAYQYKIDNYVFSQISPGTDSLKGSNIWTDGATVYFSDTSVYNNYEFVNGSFWELLNEFTGLTSFNGDFVWTDGTDIYYSNTTSHYVLDKANRVWSAKTWNGLTSFSGNQIWSDGTNTYCSKSTSSGQYILDKATSTWTQITWQTYGNVIGYAIWSDGIDIYYSSGSTQKVLNTSTSAWENMTWTGLTNFTGSRTFRYNGDIYVIQSASPYEIYKLDISTHTWTNATSDFDMTACPTIGSWFRGDMFYTAGEGRCTCSLKATPR